VRALVTGASGFAGSHLCEYLLAQPGWEVQALCWAACSTENLDSVRERITMLSGDLLDPAWTARTVAEVRPEAIFHLAGQSSPAASFSDPSGTFVTNINGQVHLFEAVLQAGLDPAILVIGSGEEYGMVRPEDVPVDEDAPLRPANPYAVSKIAQDFLALQYFLSRRLRAVRVRPFNHIGPRQAPGFVTADFARQIARIEAGQRPPVIRVGNLSARRDFTDVHDMVRAYCLAVTQGEPGQVYNIGSGVAHSIEEVLHALLGLSQLPIQVETDPQRMRPVDVPLLVCDSSRFRQRTGWEPQIPLEQSLRDILDYWRRRVPAEKE
jgi:GDP-4-dehydro-6-deoxy-D-mannose reductase